MKRFTSSSIGLIFLIGFVSSAEATINITAALIQNGAVYVAGNQAQRRAPIFWEGVRIGISSNPGGAFALTTAIVPQDCVGRLQIGTEERDVVISNCTPTLVIDGGVLKTGQQQCTLNGVLGVCPGAPAGQDGETQKGVARTYTDNGDGTITDNGTGLHWERLTHGNASQDYNNPHDVDNTYNWTGALGKIAVLNTPPCFANHCDWRLPNVNELQSLVDYGQVNPSVNPIFKTGNDLSGDSWTVSFAYWSSTASQSLPNLAWSVSFFAGVVDVASKTTGLSVRAVRGGN